MFTAKIKQDSGILNVLDEKWLEQGELLRGLTQRGALVCPHCGQDILLRDGALRRRHFAHKSLVDCPFKDQSAEVVDVKVRLYQWLESKMPGRVRMDQKLEVPDKIIYWDFVVDGNKGRKFGYWIFDRQQRDRAIMLSAAEAEGILPIVFHTTSVLKTHAHDELELTASQRDFRQGSDYDRALPERGTGYLNFVDQDGSMKIFRGLRKVHSPNLYKWQLLREGSLKEALFDPKTGEAIFTEDQKEKSEFEALKKLENLNIKAQKKVALHRREALRKAKTPYKPLVKKTFTSTVCEPAQGFENRYNKPMRCQMCGETTCDWVQMFPKDKTCICRGCNKKRFSKGR